MASLRERAGLATREVAARVVEQFSLGEAAGAETRTAMHLEELERGELDPARVSRRLLDGLAEILGAKPGALGGRFTAAAPGVVYQRSEEHAGDAFVEEIDALSHAAMAPAPAELDEVDRLFLGGPEG